MTSTSSLTPVVEHGRLSVSKSDTLRATLEIFRNHPAMRLLAVVDNNQRPVGVIREFDIRAMLFNPFGHALMSNPGFGQDIGGLVVDCAMAEEGLGDLGLIAAFSRHSDSPGLVVTREGRFAETLSSERLAEIMASARLSRAERIAGNSESFTGDIVNLSSRLSQAASRMQTLSESLVGQASKMTDAAQNVAAGASQSSTGLQDVNERGRQLAQALEDLAQVAAQARAVRLQTREVIEAAAPQVNALADSGAEIRKIIDVIRDIGRKTNFLALNAQIEAARSDDNNLGFVAVADEIKQMSRRTKGSAEEVSLKADKIGAVVGDVLSGHRGIVQAMESMSDISGRIDTAVTEQSATSLVIAGYVEQAANATKDISQGAQHIGALAGDLYADARELEQFSAMLLGSAAEISDRSREFVTSIQHA